MPGDVEITTGMSGARVFRRTLPDGRSVYVKQDPDVEREAQILRWLAGEGFSGIPAIVSYEPGELVTEALPGLTAEEAETATPEALADALRAIHAIPVTDCPFDASWAIRLQQARENVEAGLVDEEDFDDARAGRTALDLLEELEQLPPPSSPLCFTHGDFCLPNILVDAGKVSGCIDWGRAGVGHRVNDLALCARSFEHNERDDAARFLDHYGATASDLADVYAFLLLDELF